MKNTKTKLISSATVLLICFAMLIGSTFAWFTDSASTGVNKIQAGNLDVQLLMYDGTNYVDISDDTRSIFGTGSIAQNNNAQTLWEPGKTQVAYLAIKNNGTLDLKYKVDLKVTNPSDGKNLYEVMRYAITPDARFGSVTSWNPAEGSSVTEGIQTVSAMDVALKHGETHYFALSIHMQEDAGNTYKNGKVEFDLTVNAGQLSSEKDSFNEAYDVGAVYPENSQPTTPTFTVNTAAQLQAALTPTATGSDKAVVNITDNIQLADGETWTPMDLGSYNLGVHKIVINGNNHTISGLDNPLIGKCWFGDVSIEINDLTISDANMAQAESNGTGYGAFVVSADNVAALDLNNCHLKNSSITSMRDAGGLVGYSTAPTINIINCSVTKCTITGDSSVGGIIGYLQNTGNFTNCTITDTNLISNKIDSYRVGYAIGTATAGTVTLENVTFNGGYVKQDNKTEIEGTATELIGRKTGSATVNGDSSNNITW